jgi:hypothetical protein
MGGKVKGTSWSVILRGGRHGSQVYFVSRQLTKEKPLFIFIITVKIKII